MHSKSRREFLQLSASCALAITASRSSLLRGETTNTPRSAKAWITAGTQRFAPLDAPRWKAGTGGGNAGIRIDPAKQFQSILGFGAAFTDASCYHFDQLAPRDRAALLSEFFGSDGMRFSVGRTCIGSSDYSLDAYSFDESAQPDPQLKHFSIAHDRAYILPALKQARQLNPELFLFSSPWSPPGWMKSGGSMLGGSMRKKYLEAYADYFVHFLQGYAAEGVKINGVTIQNEVDTDQDGRMPAALWAQEYEAEFIKTFLGPALQAASLDTKIWMLDHNYNLWGRVVDELSDPDVYKYVDGVAWHGYAGNPEAMTRVHDAYPDKHAYWTEGGPDYTSPTYATNWSEWSRTFTGTLKNWARCIVGWNLALDEAGKPNIGPFDCGGLVTIDSKTRRITRSGQYWAFAHYSKAIQRGARVIASEGSVTGVSHLAARNPDGSYVLVLTTGSEAQSIPVAFGSEILEIKLPPDAVATLVW
jgi:glucosylceramidase